MTTMALSSMESVTETVPRPAAAPPMRPPALPILWLLSLVAYFIPPAARYWQRATLWQASVIAVINTLLAFAWCWALAILFEVDQMTPTNLARYKPKPLLNPGTYREAAHSLLDLISGQWHYAGLVDRVASVAGLACFVVLAYLGPCFVLLPFGARPGSNKACFRHIGRTVFLGSSLVHYWGLAFCATLFWLAGHHRIVPFEDQGRVTAALLFVASGLIVWQGMVLVHAARREYRTDADLPQRHDPWCDNCGYNLTGIDANGRCPECGRPVLDSLGPATRLPTPWEGRPSVANVGAIARQLATLVRQPRTLFYAMPTLTGQRAAQRWLLWALLVLFLAALPMMPAMALLLRADFTAVVYAGTLLMSLAWMLFGLMMVGIETAGVATVSRMRGHPGGGIPLAAAAKVTCYSSILMLPWVILGGAQLVAYVYLSSGANALLTMLHGSLRADQVVLGVSLGIAHIGGLIWYELTVYRGIRAVQYANK